MNVEGEGEARKNKFVEDLNKNTNHLKCVSEKMVNLFRVPKHCGNLGEFQLENLIEWAGMSPYCDYELQVGLPGARPDVVVKLPNGGVLFIDAKTPLDAFLKHLEHDDDEQLKKDNIKAIKNHIYNLGSKNYWQNQPSPEFVIMFIPLEAIWLSALKEDSKLIAYAAEKNVLVATPMGLIGLLKTIYLGWSQVHIAKEAEKIKKNQVLLSRCLQDVLSIINDNKKEAERIINNIKKSEDIIKQLQDVIINKEKEVENISKLNIN